MTALLIGGAERDAINRLKATASEHIVDIKELPKKLATPEGKAAHCKQMTSQSLLLPRGFLVTYSIEQGQPIGLCRHLSVSLDNGGGRSIDVPSIEAVWMIAEEFGFWGGIRDCVPWLEVLKGHGLAINIVQAFRQ